MTRIVPPEPSVPSRPPLPDGGRVASSTPLPLRERGRGEGGGDTDLAPLKARLAAGAVTLGAWLTVAEPLVAEAMASLGFDWLAVDMEHGSAGVDAAVGAFLAAERHGCAPLARLPSADPYLARRLLDGGAVGVIVPVVESTEAFAAFARHTLYPPAGRRGVGLSRCNGWGAAFEAYLTGFQPLLIPQIETRAGVAAARAIAALPEVDGLFLGPYDLSADLGCAGDFTNPAFTAAAAEVMAACAAHGKAPGIHQVAPEPDALASRINGGFRFIAYATDIIALRHGLMGVGTVARTAAGLPATEGTP